MLEVLLGLTPLMSALLAGFFFSCATSVKPGLQKLDDTNDLLAMQYVHRAVLNPLFLACFFGTSVLLIVSTIIGLRCAPSLLLPVFCACVIHTVGVLGITGLQNEPLNNRLERFDLWKSTNPSGSQLRIAFEKPWVYWSTIRTVCSFAVLLCLVFGLLYFRGSFLLPAKSKGVV